MARQVDGGARTSAVWTIPNIISMVRLAGVPLFLWLVIGPEADVWALVVLMISGFTDWLDGYLARRRGQVTALGQFIDPFADKLLTIAAFISLVQMGLAPAWMVAIIIGREFAVTALRSIAHARGAAMPASSLGKLKMVSQIVAILALILGKDHLHGFVVIGQVALWVVVLTSLVSAADYFRRFGKFLIPRT